ncbi:MAG: diacylglycerol kinase family protein [Acaryochloridaceae cyanobacterium SU_2_1]|nr:diacylglycerol kinase family protein [Acaryochloridaceae cyanobacterium SU_2_1]
MSNKSLISPQGDTEARSVQGRRSLSFRVAPNLFASFRYAGAGLSYTFSTQRNFRIHTLIGSIGLSLGLLLHLQSVELAVIALTSGLVLVMELLNTALEAVVDLTVERTYHELAKIAKDCAAAAVLVSAIAALVIASFLLLPPLFQALSL